MVFSPRDGRWHVHAMSKYTGFSGNPYTCVHQENTCSQRKKEANTNTTYTLTARKAMPI